MSAAAHVFGVDLRLRKLIAVSAAAAAALALGACSADSTRFDAGFGLSSSGSSDTVTTASLRPVPSEPVYGYTGSSRTAYNAPSAYSAPSAPPPAYSQPSYSQQRAAYTPQQQPTFQASPPSSQPPRVERVSLAPAKPTPQPTPAVYRPEPAPAPPPAREHTVKSGDTLSSIARRYDVSVEGIMAANGLTNTRLSLNQVLKLPAPGESPRTAVAARTHTIKDGESIYIIADRYNVDYQDLAKYNGLSRPDLIRPGQELKIPGSAAQPTQVAASTPDRNPKSEGVKVVRTRTVSVRPEPAAKPVQVASTAANVPVPDSSPVRAAAPAPSAPEPHKPTQTVSLTSPGPMSGTEFRWPVRGRVISKFGSKPNGKHNDGINVAVPLGTSVKAAENGVVAYAGNELEGYGNLILVRHADGWVSAYAHNEELLVKRGDAVKRGQIIAKAGQTGSVTQPQVHFELRKGSKPVDPLQHMAEM